MNDELLVRLARLVVELSDEWDESGSLSWPAVTALSIVAEEARRMLADRG